MSAVAPEIAEWLLDSDPAIRWQVMRDVLHESADVVAAERSRVAFEGWGAALLATQTPDGHLGGETPGEQWRWALYATKLLRDFGPDPDAEPVRRAIGLLRDNVVWLVDDDAPYFEGETEDCINGEVVSQGAYFGEPREHPVQVLLARQLDDGGWNCDAPDESSRASFNSTICVLEGLSAYERATGGSDAVREAIARGQAYLLDRRMLRSLSSGEVIDPGFARFAFPNRWRYDVLRGLDYLREFGVVADDRVAEAVGIVEERRGADGRWALEKSLDDNVPFPVDAVVGEPNRWITLRALRVLDWAGR